MPDGSHSNYDVVLIVPPIKSPFGIGFPLGLLTLATSLKKSSLSSTIVDFSLEIHTGKLTFHPKLFDECAERIARLDPKIVGFTIQCASMPFVIAIASRLRKLSSAKIVLGGPQALAFREHGLKEEDFSEFVDQVIVGEGETQFVDYCTRILQKVSAPGLNSFKSTRFPDYSLISPVQLKQYPKLAYIDSARGCSGRCTFCSETEFWGQAVSVRGTDETVEHIRYLNQTYGISRFEFTHDNFLQPRSSVSEFLEKLERASLKISWSCRTRIETLNAEILAKMKRACCYSILVGIETPSPRRMDVKNQRLSIERIDERISLALNAGICLTLSFICGLPGETSVEIEHTVRFAFERSLSLQVKCHVHKFCPLPYSSSKELDLVFDGSHISDMAQTEIPCMAVKKEVETLIQTYPALCRGFYSERNGSVRSVDLFLDQLNEILYHFPVSFDLFQRNSGLEIFEAISAFQTHRRDPCVSDFGAAHAPWLKDIFEFETHRYRCPVGSYTLIQLPSNVDLAYRSSSYRSHNQPTELVEWILLHRSNGQKQASVLKRHEANALSRLSSILKKENQYGWERKGIA